MSAETIDTQAVQSDENEKLKTTEEEDKKEKTKQRLEALYKEYATRTKEIEFHSGRYHRQVGYVQTYLAAISSLASYIYLSKPDAAKPFLDGSHQFEVVMVLSFLTLFLFFLFATMMDSMQMLMINGKYVATIEKRVNDEIGGEPLMRWENEVIPYFLGTSWSSANGWLKPQPIIYVFIFGLFGFAIFTLSYFCWNLAWEYKGAYIVYTVLASVFLLFQWIKLLSVGTGFIEQESFEKCGLKSKGDKYDTDIWAFLIPVLTIALGFGVFAASASQTNTYFAYQGSSFFGLSSIPSVYIGDLFLLPFINLAIYKAFKDALSDGGMGVKILMMNFAVCLLVSSATMYGVHYMWTHDAYFGFMDFEYGELSFAGRWHLWFSSVEFAVILLFAYASVAYASVRKAFFKVWHLVLAFSAISIADFAVRHFWVFDKSVSDVFSALADDFLSLTPFAAALAVYIAVKNLQKN